MKLGYLGPETTNSWKAAQIFSGGRHKLVQHRRINDVLQAFLKKEVDLAIVPIENSLNDAVVPTLAFLIANADKFWRKITAEMLLPIRHMLLGQPETKLAAVKKVISIDQGLEQCGVFLSNYNWQEERANSTAEAAKIVAQAADASAVAIATVEAAKHFSLEILAQNIGDVSDNTTRFIVLGGDNPPPTGHDKTTMFALTPDEPGALHDLLGPLHYLGINLTKIASRNHHGNGSNGLKQSIFWLEAAAHAKNRNMKVAMENVRRYAKKVWVLGSYPAASHD